MLDARCAGGKKDKMELNELVKLSSKEFYEEIKQMDSSILIESLINEKNKVVKKECIKLIKLSMGKNYAQLVRKGVTDNKMYKTQYVQITIIITSLILGLINFFYFNWIIFLCLCVVNILFLIEILQRKLLESENNVYLFVFLLLPIMFSYNVLNTNQNANVNLQIIISSIIFSGVFGFYLIKIFNKIITKEKIKYLKLFNIILLSINTIIGSLFILINNEGLLKKLKIILFPVVLGLCVQRVCIEYLNTKVDNQEIK